MNKIQQQPFLDNYQTIAFIPQAYMPHHSITDCAHSLVMSRLEQRV